MGSGQFVPPSDFGVGRLASQSPVVLFSKTTCCMCHTVRTLFQELKVRCVVHELDQEPKGTEMERVLISLGRTPAVPAVFIGGTLIGGVNEVMALHLRNSLVPMLTDVGAL